MHSKSVDCAKQEQPDAFSASIKFNLSRNLVNSGSCTWPMALNNEKDNISLRSKGSCQDLVAHFCQKKLVSFVSSNCRQSIIHINEYGSIEDEGKSFILKHKRVTNPVFYDIQTANHVDHEGKQLY